jgi:cell division protein FtsB
MNPELVNLYIEQLLIEIGENAKSRILLQTQLRYTERVNAQLQTRISELEAQVEKLNKKKSKEVNTSDQF